MSKEFLKLQATIKVQTPGGGAYVFEVNGARLSSMDNLGVYLSSLLAEQLEALGQKGEPSSDLAESLRADVLRLSGENKMLRDELARISAPKKAAHAS